MTAVHISKLNLQQKFTQSNLTPNALNNSAKRLELHNEKNQKKSSISQPEIDVLFEQMDKIYPYTFTSRYGVVDSGIWLSTLQHLRPEELKIGLEKMATPGTKYTEFPPSPLAFRDLCRQPHTERTHHAAYEEYRPALPRLRNEADIQAKNKAIHEMRSKLGMR